MLIQKTNPAGIDIPVQNLQKYIHDRLLEVWEIDSAQYQAYGMCYRNRRQAGYIAEVYTGKNEYKEVYWNDNLSAISFFGRSGATEFDSGSNKTDIHLVFFVNIEKVKANGDPAITHRGDEEVRRDVQNAIGPGMFGFKLISIELWLENVLREYQGTLRGQAGLSNEQLKTVDMHPVHCFRINLKALFDINNC